MIDRRSILRAALFVAAAPIIVRANSIMHIRSLGEWRQLTPSIEHIDNDVLMKVERVEMRGGEMWGFIGRTANPRVQPMEYKSLAQIKAEGAETTLVVQPWQYAEMVTDEYLDG